MIQVVAAQRVLKPHYQLLGMLLEREELRAKLSDFVLYPQSRYLEYDQVIAEISQLITELDEEIRTHYQHALDSFAAEGRGEAELKAFVGDDLVDELNMINQMRQEPALTG